MRGLAKIAAAAALPVLAAACASTPRGATAPQDYSSLALCRGVAISNAPAMDKSRRIVNFDAQARVRGTRLLRAPVKSCVSSGFGPRKGGAGSFHHGLDLYTGRPALVAAGGDGVIESVGSLRGYGKTVVISHGGGVKTRYAHLSRYERGLEPGTRVRLGQPIGRTGDTGNATAVHLHYEVIVDGRRHNPLTIGS